MSKARKKKCADPSCVTYGQYIPLSKFPKNASKKDGHENRCKKCHAGKQRKRDQAAAEKRDAEAAKFLREQEERARRIASDTDALRPEDFDASPLDEEYDVSVGNIPGQNHVSASASRQKRQEFNAEMGAHAEDLKRAAATAHQRGGDVLSGMSGRSGSYVAKLAEQERRFQNRRLARTISLAQASEELNLQRYKQVAAEYFRDKIQATGYAKKPHGAPIKRTVVLLLSDLHIGSELSSLDEPMPFRAIEEARRLEYVMRQAIDYKPQYRKNTKLCLLWNGDVIEGQLLHQLGAGAPLAEQKAAIWSYGRQMMAEFSSAFPEVEVHWQGGNHGRDKVRHPGRATWRKWDGHEFEVGWALKEMCSGLRNVTWHQPFRAVSIVNLHGSILGLTHGDTEVKVGHPDTAAERNARELDKINATRLWDVEFDAWAFGHYHTPRYHCGHLRTIWNGALVPPNGHARGEGYIGDPCGQYLWEAVEGHPIGDVRFLELGRDVDRDEKLGKIVTPFRFPTQHEE